MSPRLGSFQHDFRANWRLGPATDPGWFHINGDDMVPGRFAIATKFALHWHLPTLVKDGIYNILHAVTLGRADSPGKIHIEQLAQILNGALHITCRITDRQGRVQRNTVALPDSWHHYQDRELLLIYTADTEPQHPNILKTINVLYDCHSMAVLQYIPHKAHVECMTDLDFACWPNHSVICDHEQYNVPRDHVMVHGSCLQQEGIHTPFTIGSIWTSLGQTLDALDAVNVQALIGHPVPDCIGSAQAWYNCNCDHVLIHQDPVWTVCTGRYRQTNGLGLTS